MIDKTRQQARWRKIMEHSFKQLVRTACRLLFPVLVLIPFTADGLWAQSTAQINGTVKDPTGAVLPGVEVTATQTETGLTRMSITNETGAYLLTSLPVGPYRLEAALPGFRTHVQA